MAEQGHHAECFATKPPIRPVIRIPIVILRMRCTSGLLFALAAVPARSIYAKEFTTEEIQEKSLLAWKVILAAILLKEEKSRHDDQIDDAGVGSNPGLY